MADHKLKLFAQAVADHLKGTVNERSDHLMEIHKKGLIGSKIMGFAFWLQDPTGVRYLAYRPSAGQKVSQSLKSVMHKVRDGYSVYIIEEI